MPNHIKNKLELIGSNADIDAMIAKFSTYHKAEIRTAHDGAAILRNKSDDFNVLWLNLSNGICHNRDGAVGYGVPEGFEIEIRDSLTSFPDFAKVIPPPSDDPAYNDLPSQDVAKNSPNWWYNWNTKNWGSKWGGYSYERLGITTFIFETAWSSCHIIIEAMSLQFPSVTIKYTWADEDTGHNSGRAVYHNGLIEMDRPEGGTKEAYDISFELRPDRKENYELINGKYQYKDEE